jgi:hypothetical protein
MTSIHRARIEHPMAWRGSDIKGKDAIAFDLSARHAAALEELLHRNAALPLAEIGPAACRHPALDADLERLFEQVQGGRGIAIVRGFPVARHAPEEVGRMFWMLGAHLGRGVSQSALGNL